MTYNFYIGSNNKTGRLEIDYLDRLTNLLPNGFTVQRAMGVWKGKQEDSLIVTIDNIINTYSANLMASTLAITFNQEAVGFLRISKKDLEYAYTSNQ